MFRFLHLADLHLGWSPKRLGTKAPERQKQRDTLIQRAVDYALEEKLELVVIAGDLFETHRPSDALAQTVLTQLRRLMDAGVQLITTPGNHDEITYADSVYHKYKDEWPGVLVMNPIPAHVTTLFVAGDPVHVYSLAYTGGITPASEPLRDLPRLSASGFHLAVFHGTIGKGDERSLPLDRGALEAAQYDYVALGHIHQPSVTQFGRTPVVYSGCLEGKGFDDPGVPYWTVIEVSGSKATVTKPELGVQPIIVKELDVTPLDSQDAVEKVIAGLVDNDTMVRVRLTGALHFSLDAEALERRYRDAFYYLELRDETDAIGEKLLEVWAAERTIRGVFVKRMWDKLQAATSEQERQQVTRALRYGVRALRGQT